MTNNSKALTIPTPEAAALTNTVTFVNKERNAFNKIALEAGAFAKDNPNSVELKKSIMKIGMAAHIYCYAKSKSTNKIAVHRKQLKKKDRVALTYISPPTTTTIRGDGLFSFVMKDIKENWKERGRQKTERGAIQKKAKSLLDKPERFISYAGEYILSDDFMLLSDRKKQKFSEKVINHEGFQEASKEEQRTIRERLNEALNGSD